MSAVQVEKVSKAYPGVKALSEVSFTAGPGEILGILGPNGAGKTTLIEILEGLRKLDSGHAEVLGVDVRRGLKSIRHRMGVAMQRAALPPVLTVLELLELYAVLYPNARDIEELIERLGLEEKRDTRIDKLSGGQQQRLSVALAMIGRPELLFLDEPTSALDPQGRRAVWDFLLEEMASADRTVLLTTHQMQEAQTLCTRVAILDHGKILDIGSPRELIDRHCPGHLIVFRTSADAEIGEANGTMAWDVVSRPDPREASTKFVTLKAEEFEPAMERLLSARQKGEFMVEELRVERHTLEDVFLKLTGRRIRD